MEATAQNCNSVGSRPSLVKGDDDHERDSGKHGDDLFKRLPQAGLSLEQLGNDGDGGDVDEAAGGEGEDPGAGSRVALGQKPDHRPGHRPGRRRQLKHHGFPLVVAVGREKWEKWKGRNWMGKRDGEKREKWEKLDREKCDGDSGVGK